MLVMSTTTPNSSHDDLGRNVNLLQLPSNIIQLILKEVGIKNRSTSDTFFHPPQDLLQISSTCKKLRNEVSKVLNDDALWNLSMPFENELGCPLYCGSFPQNADNSKMIADKLVCNRHGNRACFNSHHHSAWYRLALPNLEHLNISHIYYVMTLPEAEAIVCDIVERKVQLSSLTVNYHELENQEKKISMIGSIVKLMSSTGSSLKEISMDVHKIHDAAMIDAFCSYPLSNLKILRLSIATKYNALDADMNSNLFQHLIDSGTRLDELQVLGRKHEMLYLPILIDKMPTIRKLHFKSGWDMKQIFFEPGKMRDIALTEIILEKTNTSLADLLELLIYLSFRANHSEPMPKIDIITPSPTTVESLQFLIKHHGKTLGPCIRTIDSVTSNFQYLPLFSKKCIFLEKLSIRCQVRSFVNLAVLLKKSARMKKFYLIIDEERSNCAIEHTFAKAALIDGIKNSESALEHIVFYYSKMDMELATRLLSKFEKSLKCFYIDVGIIPGLEGVVELLRFAVGRRNLVNLEQFSINMTRLNGSWKNPNHPDHLLVESVHKLLGDLKTKCKNLNLQNSLDALN